MSPHFTYPQDLNRSSVMMLHNIRKINERNSVRGKLKRFLIVHSEKKTAILTVIIIIYSLFLSFGPHIAINVSCINNTNSINVL